MAFYLDYSEHKCGCWLKIVKYCDKRDNSVLYGEKKKLNLV